MRTRLTVATAVASVAVGALVAAIGVTSTNATPRVSDPIAIETVGQAITVATQTTESWEAESADTAAALADQYRADLQPTAAYEVDVSQALAWEVDLDTTLLRVPIVEGDGVIEPSAVSLLIDRHTGKLNSTLETVFFPQTDSSGLVRAWVDGQLKVNEVVSDPVASTTASSPVFETAAAGIKPAKPIGSVDWWLEINKCLANAGIPAWVLAGISIICGAACLAAGTGPGLVACALCIAAAVGFASGVVQGCVLRANKAK